MSRRIALIVVALMLASIAHAGGDGLVVKQSPHSARVTLDRWEALMKKKGIRVFARISHQKNAEGVGLKLRPTELLIFGNPKLGTRFFTSRQSAGIDLPMKALAWEDEQGRTWLAYNDPRYIARRHGITDRDAIVEKMQGALEKFSDYAIGN